MLNVINPVFRGTFRSAWRTKMQKTECFVRYLATDSDTSLTVPETDIKKPMDRFLDNLHLKHKLHSDKFVKKIFVQKNDQRIRENRRQNDRILRERSYLPSNSISGNLFRNPDDSSPTEKPTLHNALEQLKKSEQEGAELSVRFLNGCASVFSENGLPVEVRLCQKIMDEHHSQAFRENIQLNHYLANALWNAGEYREAIVLFGQIFSDYPGQRRKIANLFRFCVLRAVKEYPCPEQMELIQEFVGGCARLGEHAAGLHLWQALYENPIPAANEEAYKLLLKYPRIKELVLRKFPSLLKSAREKETTSVLFRMLTLIQDINAPEKDIKHYTGCIYDALMDIYCANEDHIGAKNIFNLASEDAASKKQIIWPQTAQKLFSLLSRLKSEIPPEVLNAKYNRNFPKTSLKMRF